MAAISRISALPDAQVPTARQGADRASRAEAGPALGSSQAQIPRSKGVGEVLKDQKDNELRSKLPSEADMRALVESLQKTIDRAVKHPYRVGFRHEEKTGIPVIEIRDEEGHIVKQFPPEKVLNLQRKMDELSGMVIDEVI